MPLEARWKVSVNPSHHWLGLLDEDSLLSQVCALQWNTHEKEILSSHGFSQNQLCLWRYPSMAKVGEFNGHTSRVLHLSQSPDGTSVCSAAADETLRFWRVFGEPARIRKAKTEQAERISLLRTIR